MTPAEKQKRHRERKNLGEMVLPIVSRPDRVRALREFGELGRDEIDDRHALTDAYERIIDEALGTVTGNGQNSETDDGDC